ncbi:ApeP family dehydratase [Methylomagnum sp.]
MGHGAGFPAVRDLVPQAGAMLLLDRVLDMGEGYIVVGVKVRDDGLFSGADGTVPAWVGIEYMAQTVAAYSGYQRLCRGGKVDLGFLLGTRHYECSVGEFPCGTQLIVRAELEIEGLNGLSVFACHIEAEGISAAAKLNVFLPEDSKIYLAEKGL